MVTIIKLDIKKLQELQQKRKSMSTLVDELPEVQRMSPQVADMAVSREPSELRREKGQAMEESEPRLTQPPKLTRSPACRASPRLASASMQGISPWMRSNRELSSITLPKPKPTQFQSLSCLGSMEVKPSELILRE